MHLPSAGGGADRAAGDELPEAPAGRAKEHPRGRGVPGPMPLTALHAHTVLPWPAGL